MLKVQQYLKKHSLEELSKEYGIEYKKKNGKVSLHYNIFKSPKEIELCNECCGLVLRDFSWDVISYPFNRVFNYKDPLCPRIKYSMSTFVETMGGVLVQAYYDPLMDEWCIATEKTPEGNDLAGRYYADHRMLTMMAFDKMGKPFDKVSKKMDTALTYVFELITPYSKPYRRRYPNDVRITLVGARDLITLRELDPVFANMGLGLPVPRECKFFTASKAIGFIRNRLDEYSGLVARPTKPNGLNFERIKFQSTIKIRNIIRSLKSDRDIVRAVLLGYTDDVFPYANKELQKRILRAHNAVIKLIKKIEEDLEDIKDIPEQRDYSVAATSKDFPGPLFYVRRNKWQTVSDFLQKYAVNKNNANKILERVKSDL